MTVCNYITNQLTEISCICVLENFVHSNSERKTTEVRMEANVHKLWMSKSSK